MPNPAADPVQDPAETGDTPPKNRAAGRLAWLAAAACAACCALPALVAAGLLGGGALAVAAWLPTVALVLAVAAVAVFGWTRWHRPRAAGSGHGCPGSSCGCGPTDGDRAIVAVSVRSRP